MVPSTDPLLRDVLHLARGVASDFEGVAIERVAGAEVDDVTWLELLVSVPRPNGGVRHRAMVRVRRDEVRQLTRDLRAEIKTALRQA